MIVVSDWESLRTAQAEGGELAIQGFFKDFHFLSNFHPSLIEVERIQYATVEHAFQAMKTRDRDERLSVAAKESPGAAKKAGRKVTLRSDWEQVKVGIMKDLVLQKFQEHEELRELLLATGECHLEETNTWRDRFWGVCGGQGQNHLGKILMEVRDELLANS